jgi:excisionase family DNA binding protein
MTTQIFSQDQPTNRVGYSLKEAAEMLGVSVSHLYVLKRRGLLQVVKLGTRSIVSHRELTRLAESGA